MQMPMMSSEVVESGRGRSGRRYGTEAWGPDGGAEHRPGLSDDDLT